MLLYPELPKLRNKQIRGDLSVVACLLLFALLAWAVRAAVLTLRIISTGLTSVSDALYSDAAAVAEALASLPLLGSNLGGLLEGMADGSLGTVSDVSQEITDAITLTANVLGLATFAMPTALIAVFWLPVRVRRAQSWGAAAGALGAQPYTLPATGVQVGPAGEASTAGATLVQGPPPQLVAMRALCQIPLVDLAKFEPRPFEAYAQGRYEALCAALYAYEGLRPALQVDRSGGARAR